MRQLPPRQAIEVLAEIYFSQFNWQYAMLDRVCFWKRLAEWYARPLCAADALIPRGSGGVAGGVAAEKERERERERGAFPAVVFQVCAVALLAVGDGDPAGAAEGLEELARYAGGVVGFGELAREYSECGVEMSAVLGKRGMGVNTVVAGWLRGSWLKYVGLVTEAVRFPFSDWKKGCHVGMG